MQQDGVTMNYVGLQHTTMSTLAQAVKEAADEVCIRFLSSPAHFLHLTFCAAGNSNLLQTVC